jgi:hypothetical protein
MVARERQYPEAITIRLPRGSHDRIDKVHVEGEALSDTRRRIWAWGLAVCEGAVIIKVSSKKGRSNAA